MLETDDFNSARADGGGDGQKEGNSRKQGKPAVSGISWKSGGPSLPFCQKWPEVPGSWPVAWPGRPWMARIQGLGGSWATLDGPDPGLQEPWEGSWASQGVPARPRLARPAWPDRTWILSNTCPGSPEPGLDDRAQMTEHAGTRTAKSTRNPSRPGAGRAP